MLLRYYDVIYDVEEVYYYRVGRQDKEDINIKARGMNAVSTKSMDEFLVFSPELVLVPKY